MAIRDLLHFDSDAYRTKLHKCANEQVAENIYRKRREIASSGWSIGAGIALILLTAGASALGSCYAVRTMSIARQKLKLLEEEWARRGKSRLPEKMMRDLVLPCAISGTVGAIVIGLDSAFAEPLAVASAAASHAHTMTPSGHALPTYTSVHHFGDGFTNGVHQGVDSAFGTPYPQASSLTQNTPDTYYSYGQWAGVESTKLGMDAALGQAGDYFREEYAKRY